VYNDDNNNNNNSDNFYGTVTCTNRFMSQISQSENIKQVFEELLVGIIKNMLAVMKTVL